MSRLEAGQPAPGWTLPDAAGNPVSLSDYSGQDLIVYFYPAAMTPGCTKQACDFRDALGALGGHGYAVVGISPDPTDRVASFASKEGLSYPVLSDVDKAVLTAYGAYGEKKLYGKTVTGVIRSTVVLDGEGTVRLAKYNVKATGHVSSLARALGVSLA